MNTSIGTLLDFKGSQVFSVPATFTVAEAVLEMNRHNVGSVVVMDGFRMIGMFTARDVLRKVIPDLLDPRTTPVRLVMHDNCPLLTRDMGADEAMDVFEGTHFRHLPIMDGERVAGVLSIGDLARWCATANRAEAESLRCYIQAGVPC